MINARGSLRGWSECPALIVPEHLHPFCEDSSGGESSDHSHDLSGDKIHPEKEQGREELRRPAGKG